MSPGSFSIVVFIQLSCAGRGTCLLEGKAQWRAFHRCHARRSVWPFSKNASRRGRRSREAGRDGRASQFISTWRSFPRPAGVLAPAEDGAVALGLRQGPDLGVHHPVAYRLATSPAPPPSPSIRFMTRVPARAMRQVWVSFEGWDKQARNFYRDRMESMAWRNVFHARPNIGRLLDEPIARRLCIYQ